jgi:hypothetical protein
MRSEREREKKEREKERERERERESMCVCGGEKNMKLTDSNVTYIRAEIVFTKSILDLFYTILIVQ